MVVWMVDYFYNRVQNLILKYSVAKHYQSLNEETGGMNDVLYKLYSITVCTAFVRLLSFLLLLSKMLKAR